MEPNDRMNRDLYTHIRQLMERSMYRHRSGPEYYTAYNSRWLFDWDSYFEGVVQLYMGYGTRLQRSFVTLFLSLQREDGFIPRYDPPAPQTVYPQMDDELIKPFLAQSAVLCLHYDGQIDWLGEENYRRMEKYLRYWLERQTKNGFAYYRSGPHSGYDTQTERCGGWEADFDGAVDLNTFLYRELYAFSIIADTLGKTQDSETFCRLADEQKARVLSMWDEADGFFYDVNVRTGQPIRVKTTAAFAPMWAGIASPRQAQILTYDHLFNPNEFFRLYPFATLAANEPGYSAKPLPGDIGVCNWRANTWIPTNYMAMHGLMTYGYHDLAELVAYKTAELLAKSHDCEFYDAETGAGCGESPFSGWSLLGYFMPMEALEGFDPTDLELDADDMYALMPYFRLPPDIVM